jgi:hypothetical protein
MAQRAARHGHQARAVHAHLFGLFQEDGKKPRDADSGGMAEHGDRQGAARQQHEGGDFGGFDDVAGFVGLLQPFGCRLFGLLGLVLVARHVLFPVALADGKPRYAFPASAHRKIPIDVV